MSKDVDKRLKTHDNLKILQNKCFAVAQTYYEVKVENNIEIAGIDFDVRYDLI